MTKLKWAVHLDYVTIKPYLKAKNLLIFSAVALFYTTMSDSVLSGISVGLMIATLFISYPFVLCEKNNLDALYTTLSINRITVVRGRYLFTLLLNLGAVLFSFILATAGLWIANAVGFSTGAGDEGYLYATLLLAALFILIQCIQLPFFFKLGYTKAKVLSFVPFIALMSGYLAVMTAAPQNINATWAGLLGKLTDSGLIMPLLVALIVAIVFVSYGLSAVFYKKREF